MCLVAETCAASSSARAPSACQKFCPSLSSVRAAVHERDGHLRQLRRRHLREKQCARAWEGRGLLEGGVSAIAMFAIQLRVQCPFAHAPGPWVIWVSRRASADVTQSFNIQTARPLLKPMRLIIQTSPRARCHPDLGAHHHRLRPGPGPRHFDPGRRGLPAPSVPGEQPARPPPRPARHCVG